MGRCLMSVRMTDNSAAVKALLERNNFSPRIRE